MRRNWQRQLKRCWLIPRWSRKWDGGASNASKMNSVSARSQNLSGKFCASYANPERHAIVRAVLRIRRASRESGVAGQRIDAARARCDGSYRGLVVRIARGVRKKCGQHEALSVWMDERSERRAERILADVVPLPRGDLESCDHQILPGAAWRLRCGAHFRLIRLTWPRSRPAGPETENSISHRAHRNVCAHRAKHFSKTPFPPTPGPPHTR